MGCALPVPRCDGGAVVARTLGHTWFAVARRAILENERAIDLRPMRRRRGNVFKRCGRALRHVQRNDRRCASSRRLVNPSSSLRNGAAPSGEDGLGMLGKAITPEQLPDASAGQERLAEFNKLYEKGEFQLGYCLADVQVNEEGTVDTVRVVRPRNVDKRVESAIVRSMKSRRYRPATACGRPVPFTISVGVFHCPSQPKRGRKPGVSK